MEAYLRMFVEMSHMHDLVGFFINEVGEELTRTISFFSNLQSTVLDGLEWLGCSMIIGVCPDSTHSNITSHVITGVIHISSSTVLLLDQMATSIY